MPDFFTKVQIPEPGFKIDYRNRLMFMGSCFSDLIGGRMQTLKFNVCHNPFGVVYNPLSVARSIKLLLNKEKFTEADISFYNELWFSYTHSTKFSDPDKRTCLKKINERFEQAKQFILQADVLFLSLGTSWVFELKDTGHIVANCHKMPSAEFNRFFSDVENTVGHLQGALEELKRSNAGLKIVFTVSPIRHWKDGAVENQKSKAALILAVSRLQELIEGTDYFPAYEIFMDELRDYRFYSEDLLHPSESGVEYTWKRFSETYFTEKTKKIQTEVNSVLNRTNHRPLHKNTEAYLDFVSSLKKDIAVLQEKYPFIDLNMEMNALRKNV
jgi:hypothetical protein